MWGSPPERPLLEPGSVHLWRVPLVAPSLRTSPTEGRGSKSFVSEAFDCLPSLDGRGRGRVEGILSPDEVARAARLRVPEKAQAFTIGRARLRQILARYLDCPPADIAFAYGPHGKPALADSTAPLHFNLAHSGALLLLAVADRPVGIDLECIDSAVDFLLLAKRFFTPGEQSVLLQAPLHRRRRIFYRLWTRREAYLKGRGGGFSDTSGTANGGWCFGTFFVQRQFVAAAAVHGEKIGAIQRWACDVGPDPLQHA